MNIALGWRVPPHGRSAHYMTIDTNQRDRFRYVTACGRVFICSYVDEKPLARECVGCQRAVDGHPTTKGDDGE